MINYCSTNKPLNISEQNTYLFNIISNKKLLYSFFDYLSVSEITKFMLMNKEIYSKFNNKDTYLFYKYMFKRYNSSFFFFDQKKVELRQLNEILKLIKYSDILYQQYYKTINNFIVVYYIFGFIDIFDIFPIAYYFKKKIARGILHIPFILMWFLSIILLLVYQILKCNLNKKLNKFIDSSVREINEDKTIKERLLKNIRRRTKYKNPKGFKVVSSVYLILYTPVIFNLIWKTSAVKLFKAAAYGILAINFAIDLVKMIYIKCKQKNKLNIYKKLFSKNHKDLELFENKKTEIYNKIKRAGIGGKMMGFSYFVGFLLLFILYVCYINIFISKLTDPNSNCKWSVILIPVDILGFFIALYTCIYLCSIRKLNMKYKWILFITSTVNLTCFLLNFVLLPNIGLITKITISPAVQIGVSIVFSISLIIHYIYNKKSEGKYNK